MSDIKVTRRDFLKTTGLGATASAAALGIAGPTSGQSAAANVDRAAVVAAMGDMLIPSDPGDPGYKTLEPYNITPEVMKNLELSDGALDLFNSRAAEMFAGKTFLELSKMERAEYFDSVFAGEKFDKATGEELRRTLWQVRESVFRVYYKNYPEHTLPRDRRGVPILPAADTHQITNPNTKLLVTGWDVAAFMGPLTWEEEQRRRELVKKIDWNE